MCVCVFQMPDAAALTALAGCSARVRRVLSQVFVLLLRMYVCVRTWCTCALIAAMKRRERPALTATAPTDANATDNFAIAAASELCAWIVLFNDSPTRLELIPLN